MHTEGVVAIDPWRKNQNTVYAYVAHTHCKRPDVAFRKHDALV